MSAFLEQDLLAIERIRDEGRADVADHWLLLSRAVEGGAFEPILEDPSAGSDGNLRLALDRRAREIVGEPPSGFDFEPRAGGRAGRDAWLIGFRCMTVTPRRKS